MPSRPLPPPADAATSPAAPPWGPLLDASRPAPEATLFWTTNALPRAELIAAPTTLGSAPDAPICVLDKSISRLHLAITPSAGGVWVEDLGSTNGTFYQGAQIVRACLRDGARFVAGKTEFTLRHAPAGAEAPLFPFDRFGSMRGRSAVMRELFARIESLADSPETALIHGETGTGKELVAEALHTQSRRARGPFVVVDCGALAESLLDSELFGHLRGSFTGAVRDREGAFHAADGGTLFLDEIGELPLALQPRLLRAIESRTVRRVGATAYEHVDVRFVCATHRDLRAMVNAGSFREDLYFRLAVLRLELPPLRERSEDVLLLLRHFLPPAFADAPMEPDVEREILARRWPGNVRELRNFAGRVTALGWRGALDADKSADAPRESRAPSLPLTTPPEPVTDNTALPPELLRGSYADARDGILAQWERAYVRALRERHGGDTKSLLAESGITRGYLSKLSNR